MQRHASVWGKPDLGVKGTFREAFRSILSTLLSPWRKSSVETPRITSASGGPGGRSTALQVCPRRVGAICLVTGGLVPRGRRSVFKYSPGVRDEPGEATGS